MFELREGLKFINVDIGYLKALHKACSEVRYRERGYDNKPFIGVLISNEDGKYVIPLSSAKEKHKTWKNIEHERYLIYEMADKSAMSLNDIWVEQEGEDEVKHILSVLDVKKMIPIKEGVYQKIDLNPASSDSEEEKKYKDLLNKEYSFCLKIMDDVIEKANKIYERQIKSGKIQKFCCDFKLLEEVCCTYEE